MLGQKQIGAKRLAVVLFRATSEPDCVLTEHINARQPVKRLAGFSFSHSWHLDKVVKAHSPLWPPHSKERCQSREVGAKLLTASPDSLLKKVGATPGTMSIADCHAWLSVFPLP